MFDNLKIKNNNIHSIWVIRTTVKEQLVVVLSLATILTSFWFLKFKKKKLLVLKNLEFYSRLCSKTGKFRIFWKNLENFWKNQKNSENFWKNQKNSEIFGKNQKNSEIFGKNQDYLHLDKFFSEMWFLRISMWLVPGSYFFQNFN